MVKIETPSQHSSTDPKILKTEYSKLTESIYTETNMDIESIINNDSNIQILNKYKNYFTIDEYNNLPHLNYLSIYSLNINSLNKYKNELELFILNLKHKFDIIIISEIRTNQVVINNLELNENYNYFYDFPIECKCGGLLVLIKKKFLNKTYIVSKKSENGLDCITIQLDDQKLKLIAIYKHPHKNISDFQSKLKGLLSDINREYKVIIAGDTNIDFLKYNEDNRIKNYFDSLTKKKFINLSEHQQE